MDTGRLSPGQLQLLALRVNRDNGTVSVLLNILWLVLAGWWLALHHFALALALAVTIIGISFA